MTDFVKSLYLIMIRFLINRKVCKGLPGAQTLLKPTPLSYGFCSDKTDNEQKSSNSTASENEKKKMKITMGANNSHPLYQMAHQRMLKNIKIRFEEQKKLLQQIKQKANDEKQDILEDPYRAQAIKTWQTIASRWNEFFNRIKKLEEKKKKTDDGKNSEDDAEAKIKWELKKSTMLLLLVFIVFGEAILRKMEERWGITSDQSPIVQINEYLYKQIQMSKSPIHVEVKRKQLQKNYRVSITMNGVTKQNTINQQGLTVFLARLQEFHNDNIKVSFSFGQITGKTRGQLLLEIAVVVGFIFISRKIFQDVSGLWSNVRESVKKPIIKSAFVPIQPESNKILFTDVAGMHEAKVQVTEFIHFLKDSSKYFEIGAKVPKGVLLTGPPGTGKTLLARACAGQTGVNFFSLSGSQFVQKFSGLGASRVRQLFDKAEQMAPSIIFIDEIDAIGKKRDAGPFSNEERDNTLNQLLVRMDGFASHNQVVVMAATNRKDMLDPALLRPGRFDRSVEIGLPNFEERQEILAVHLKKVHFAPLVMSELAKKIAVLTPGFSGAELANTCNQAAILAAREGLESIELRHFEKATERVMAGLEKRNVFTEQEKEMLAFYQCGKAIVSWFTEGSDPIIKISILPFSKSNTGFSHSIKSQTGLLTMDELLAKVCCYLAGRASEMHFKGYTTTNGDNDLQRAKQIITMIVTKFGMSKELKMIAYPDIQFIRKPYSEKVESIIDEEIVRLSQECQSRVETLIQQKQKQILQLKEALLEKETLTHNCIKDILGERQVLSDNANYEQYLKGQQEEQNKNVEEGGVIQPQPGTS